MASFCRRCFCSARWRRRCRSSCTCCKREPEPRVKFAAVKLLRAGAGRAHRPAAAARAAAAGAAGGGAACCSRWRSRVRSSRPARPAARPASTIVALDTSLQPVGARPVRARAAAGEGRDQSGAGRRSGRRRDVCRRRADRRRKPGADRALASAAIDAGAAGFGATRYRGRAVGGGRRPSAAAAARSSSSPTCRRTAGTPATARRCRSAATIEIADVGAPPPNLAVTAFAPLADRVVATVRNTGDRARETRACI